MLKKIPEFVNEQEEQQFWLKQDSVDYVDWEQAQSLVLSHLKPTTQMISLYLPEMMFEQLKLLANKRDVSYQSLLKIFLAERIHQELTTNV